MERSVPEGLLQEWQSIVDLLARIMNVPAALIMRVTEDDIEVFVSSHTEKNPYKVGDKEYLQGSGLYCETVINKQAKLVLAQNVVGANELWLRSKRTKLENASRILSRRYS